MWYSILDGILEYTKNIKLKKKKKNVNVGSQEIPGVIGKFGLGVQNEAGKRLEEFCQDNALVIENTFSNNTRYDSTRGHHQMINTKIRLIIFFAAKDGEALCYAMLC